MTTGRINQVTRYSQKFATAALWPQQLTRAYVSFYFTTEERLLLPAEDRGPAGGRRVAPLGNTADRQPTTLPVRRLTKRQCVRSSSHGERSLTRNNKRFGSPGESSQRFSAPLPSHRRLQRSRGNYFFLSHIVKNSPCRRFRVGLFFTMITYGNHKLAFLISVGA